MATAVAGRGFEEVQAVRDDSPAEHARSLFFGGDLAEIVSPDLPLLCEDNEAKVAGLTAVAGLSGGFYLRL